MEVGRQLRAPLYPLRKEVIYALHWRLKDIEKTFPLAECHFLECGAV
jgi:hypothetical protein